MRALVIACLLLAPALRAGETSELDAYLRRCERFGFSGAALVVRKGEVAFRGGYGLADRERGTPNTTRTLFEVASTTKVFTACAVLRLAEMGKLALDDPIAEHLPGVPEDKAGITIRHLLAHTSGMSRMTAGGGEDVEAAVRTYLGPPAVRPPGQAFEYWNGGYALLAAIVARASGHSYMDFCREQVLGPAQLAATGFTGDAGLAPQAVGYAGDVAVRRAAGHPYGGTYGYQYRGMGGLVTSAEDLARWVQAYEGGKILTPASVRLMETAVSKNYGLGWGMAPTDRGTRRIGHGGDVRGFHAELERFPDEGVTIVVLCNVDGIPLWTIAWNLEALVFGGTPPYPVPPARADLPDAALDARAGTYALDADNSVVVARDAGGLRLQAAGLRVCGLLRPETAGGTDADVAAALAVVDAVKRGEAEPIEAILLEGIPRSWPGWLVTSIWPRHVAEYGPLEDVRALGACRIARGRVSVLLELRHAKGTPHLQIVLQDGKLNIFDLHGPAYAVEQMVQPVGEGRFAGFAWMGAQPAPVRFDAEGRLVLTARDGDVALEKR